MREILDIFSGREARWLMRNELSQSGTLITFTMNIIGGDKISPIWLNAHSECARDIEDEIQNFIISSESHIRAAGAETHWLVSLAPHDAKKIAIKIEETHPIGRLLDIDVMGESRDVRRKYQYHRQEAFYKNIEMVQNFLADRIASRAVRALLAEAALFPKPGLVTPFSNGAHTDMNFEMFLKSAFSLKDFFSECAKIGDLTPLQEMLAPLREIGLDAEQKMFAATGGVNTHKGALFLLGLLCASSGFLCAKIAAPSAEDIAETAGKIVDGIVEREMQNGRGGSGARGEAESGFALTLDTLQVLQKNLKTQKTRAVLLNVLFGIIAKNLDTNLIFRAGIEGLEFAQNCAKNILSLKPESQEWKNEIYETENSYIKKNLSPGGSADILSAAIFLIF